MDRFIEKVKVLDIKKGDIVVIRITTMMSITKVERLQEYYQRKIFPDNKVLILTHGADIKVTRPEPKMIRWMPRWF